MPKKKVAVVLSGGASLGSYIAGALDELIAAFATSNDYEIDIITGASAGATTAALLAHALLYRNGKTALRDVWVDQIDIEDLLAPDIPEGGQLSVLNPRHLREIAKQTIAWQDAQDPGVRAACCSDDLTVAFTITNSTGLPYKSRVPQPAAGRAESFVQYRHSEQQTFSLTSRNPPTDPVWDLMTEVALASSAIPFVFPMVRLARRADDPDQYVQKPEFDGEGHFLYYDGGTFNNLPVDLAWHLAMKRGGGLDDRVVVVINPWRNDPAVQSLEPAYPPLLQNLFGVLGAMMNESGALQFDNEVVMHSRSRPAEPAVPTGSTGPAGPAPRSFPGINRPPVELLADFALVIPKAGDKPMRGNRLHALAAFLDRRFREYDFRRGAADAQRVAQKTLQIQYDAQREPGFYDPDADGELQADLSSYQALANITSSRHPDRSVQQVFQKALDTRIDALVGRWDAPGPDIITDPAFSFLIRNLVHDQLPSIW